MKTAGMADRPLFRVSTPLMEIDPGQVALRQVDAGSLFRMKDDMSHAVARAAPGRKLGFVCEQGPTLLGIIFLASPVINLRVRDQYLDLPADPSEKGTALRGYADLSVCVPAQPIGWHWNVGKLLALLATTMGDEWAEAYGDHLTGVTTTSLWGKGSMYNRIYRFIGYTEGFGHEHIPEAEYRRMLSWMRHNNVPVPPSTFGSGSNPRMRRIAAYRKASGDKAVTLKHGNKRGVYYHAATENRADVIAAWYERWGRPRYERTRSKEPPYHDGVT